MDETDKKIIELLQQDGRLEDVEIARRTGISHDTVKRRRKKLEEACYIKIQANIIYEVLKSEYHDIPVAAL